MRKVESDLNDARSYQVENSTREGIHMEDYKKQLKEMADDLLSVKIQLRTMVFDEKVWKETKPDP